MNFADQFLGKPYVTDVGPVRPGHAIIFLSDATGPLVGPVWVEHVVGRLAKIRGVDEPLPIDRLCQMPVEG